MEGYTQSEYFLIEEEDDDEEDEEEVLKKKTKIKYSTILKEEEFIEE